jgi:FdhE protein
MDTLSGRDIENEVHQFEAFGDSYRDFLTEFDNQQIFTEKPPDDSCGTVAAHLLEGRYLLHSFGYQFEKEACEIAIPKLGELFGSYLPVRKNDLARIQEVFTSQKLNSREFITAVFRNQGNRFLEIVSTHNLEEDLATFFAVYLARLFRVKAARHLCEEIDFFNLKDWERGYCPVCGHWPALSHIDQDDEKRTLWCLNCGTTWPFRRLECIYCLSKEQQVLHFIGPDDEPKFRVQVCDNCREYMKEIHGAVPVDKFPFDSFFLGSHSLDLLARSQGFVHESPLAIEADDTTAEAHLLSHRMRLPWDH